MILADVLRCGFRSPTSSGAATDWLQAGRGRNCTRPRMGNCDVLNGKPSDTELNFDVLRHQKCHSFFSFLHSEMTEQHVVTGEALKLLRTTCKRLGDLVVAERSMLLVADAKQTLVLQKKQRNVYFKVDK